MILVTGATGNVGSHVAHRLQRQGTPVRAFVRDRRKAERLLAGVDIAVGDLADRASVAAAVEGAEAVFLSSGDSPDKVEHETGVIEAAERAGVRRIVKMSTVGAQVGSSVPFSDAHGRVEERLHRSPVPSVVLHSSFLMTNLLANAEQIRLTGRLVAPAGAARVAVTHPADVAAVATVALGTDRYDGRTLTVTGPEALTFADLARRLSAVLGRPVEFVDVPDEAAHQGLLASGLPHWLADGIVAVFAALREGVASATTGTVAEVTGHEPRSFTDFAREHAAVFGAGAVPSKA